MIWNLHVRADDDRSEMVSRIIQQITGNLGQGAEVDVDDVEELAKAIDAYLKRKDSYCVDSSYLVLLASKALSTLGRNRDARRLVVFGTGLVRPAEWVVTHDEEMWVLDLKQVTVRDDAPMELVFFGSISMIIEATADVWDGSSGRGVLGLRHVCATTLAFSGREGTRGQAEVEEELKSVCMTKLDQLRQQRGWADTPRVMNLDV